ncbi:hypothetical protein JD77_05142 [Micromonospora olivasterospora]|uniref:Uncharacterized protein n=1 Tax=Micromonospora olivasterospora TaxID=1880 RepID=A0A562IGH5_MICOL|nr:hypothetical protein JD77_05142 [Micromonospora olivasterospora]
MASDTASLPTAPATTPAALPNAGPPTVVRNAAAPANAACLPIVDQFTPGCRPSVIIDTSASSAEPGMNNICIAVPLAADRTNAERRIA